MLDKKSIRNMSVGLIGCAVIMIMCSLYMISDAIKNPHSCYAVYYAVPVAAFWAISVLMGIAGAYLYGTGKSIR